MIDALTPSDARAEFHLLSEQVRSAGLLDRQPWLASARLLLSTAAFAAGWVALFHFESSWATIGIAAFLAVASTQLLFIGHDAGHQQLFSSRRANRLVGLLVGDLLTGLSFSWWVPKHNAHHAFPNQIGRDPDIGPGAIPSAAPLDDQRKHRGSLRVCSLVLRSAPLVALEVGMHLSSGKWLAERRGRASAAEWVLIGTYAGLYLAAVFSALSIVHAAVFIAVQQGLFGLYLRLSFAPNHKGMPIIESDSTMGFVQRQVITSRNVVGGRLITFMLGGLNYQIEHHLFPVMPRVNLVRAQHLVRDFCARSGLEYREATLVDSYREAVASLRAANANPSVHGLDKELTGRPLVPGS